MSSKKTNVPVKIEKISISPKRMIYIKLWPPSTHPQWGMTRSQIEIQEVRTSNGTQKKYSTPLRIPCEGSSALLADLISNFIISGRQLNNDFKTELEQINGQNSNFREISLQELENLLIEEFKTKKLSKTRIMNILQEKGYSIDKDLLLEALEILADQNKVIKEKAVHTTSGTNYVLWKFQ